MPSEETKSLFTAMGCPCEIRLFSADKNLSLEVLRKCKEEAIRFEKKYSRYRPNSVIGKINRAAGQSAVAIDPETNAILKYSGVCYEESGGLFDITSGVLRRIWHMDTVTLPRQSEIDNCLKTIGWEKVRLEPDNVFLPEAGMELDLGGVVKEYASDSISEQARQAGIESGYVNLGGDIAIIGPQANKEPWRVGVSDPNGKGDPIATIEIKGGAITTSGGYERYCNIKGKRYSHMINPKTGWPVDSLVSVSVAAPKAVVAGSLTSIALLKGIEAGIDFLEKCGVAFFAVDQSGTCHGHLQEVTHDQ